MSDTVSSVIEKILRQFKIGYKFQIDRNIVQLLKHEKKSAVWNIACTQTLFYFSFR